MKKILFLCTGNSCRSIIAEAIINHELKDCIIAYSAGVSPLGDVNNLAKKVLKKYGIWNDEYYSKSIDNINHLEFDLVITVCSNAKEECPIYPQGTELLHIGFDDPNGKPYKDFVRTYTSIKDKLVPLLKNKFCNT